MDRSLWFHIEISECFGCIHFTTLSFIELLRHWFSWDGNEATYSTLTRTQMYTIKGFVAVQ